MGFYYQQQPQGFYYEQPKGFYYNQQQPKGFYYNQEREYHLFVLTALHKTWMFFNLFKLFYKIKIFSFRFK